MSTNKFLSVAWDYLLITLGTLIYVMAWTSFLIPNGMASGGLTGLCTIIQYGTGMPVAWTFPIINVLLLVMGFLVMGNAFGIKTIYVIGLSSLLFKILPDFSATGSPNIAITSIAPITANAAPLCPEGKE